MAHKYRYTKNNSTNVRLILKRSMTYMSVSFLSIVTPQLIRRFIKRQFFAPHSYAQFEEEKQYQKTGDRFKLTVDEQKLQCWKRGSGPVIIFVHGWNIANDHW